MSSGCHKDGRFANSLSPCVLAVIAHTNRRERTSPLIMLIAVTCYVSWRQCIHVYLVKQCALEPTCTQWAVDTLAWLLSPGQTLLVYAYTAIHIHATLATTPAQGPTFKQPSTKCGNHLPPPPSSIVHGIHRPWHNVHLLLASVGNWTNNYSRPILVMFTGLSLP